MTEHLQAANIGASEEIRDLMNTVLASCAVLLSSDEVTVDIPFPYR